MNKIKFKHLLTSGLILGSTLMLIPTVWATDYDAYTEIQLYPKGYGDTAAAGGINDPRLMCNEDKVIKTIDGIPVFNSTAICTAGGAENNGTTEPPGAVNHRAGQTFYVPEPMQLSRVRFRGFVGALNSTGGGKVRVVLRQGSSTGPELASVPAYFTGWQYNNWLGIEDTTYCRWHIETPGDLTSGPDAATLTNTALGNKKIDQADGSCRLETKDYAVSWAVMPFVTPLEVDFTKFFSQVLQPDKYSIEIVQDYARADPDSWIGSNIAQGLYNRFDADYGVPGDPNTAVSAYYMNNNPNEIEYDAYFDWNNAGPGYYSSGRDLASLAIWGTPASPPSAPTINSGSCSADGSSTSLSWSSVSGASRYDVYAFDLSYGSPNWSSACGTNGRVVCQPLTGTSASFSTTPGKSYQWFVFACSGAGCSSAATTTVNCPAVTPTAPSCFYPAPGSTVYPNVTFQWGAVPGASDYNFRLSDTSVSPWNEFVARNNLGNITSYPNPIDLEWGKTYRYRIQVNNPSAPWSDCDFSTAPSPSLGAMEIKPGDDAVVAGPNITSGLVVAQGGQNFKNSINIIQNITNSGMYPSSPVTNLSNLGLVGTAFTTSAITGGNDLWNLTNTAYQNWTFALIYAPETTSTYYSDGGLWSQPKTFDKGKFYAYYRGSWKPPEGRYINQISTELYQFDATLKRLLDGVSPTFQVHLLQGLGNQTFKTYGYLKPRTGTESIKYYSCSSYPCP